MFYITFIPMFFINLIILLFFSWSTYNAMSRIKTENQYFPAWFCWMMLIPFFGYIFAWLMLPFGIPNSFKQQLANNLAAMQLAHKIFELGLAYVITAFFAHIPLFGIPLFIVSLILLIIYWKQLLNFKKLYL